MKTLLVHAWCRQKCQRVNVPGDRSQAAMDEGWWINILAFSHLGNKDFFQRATAAEV